MTELGKFLSTATVLKELGINRYAFDHMKDPPPRIKLGSGKNSPWFYPELAYRQWKTRRFAQFIQQPAE